MNESEMKRYSIRMDVAAPRLRRRLAKRLLPVLGGAFVVAAFLAGRAVHPESSFLEELWSPPSLVIAAMILGSTWVTFRRSLKAGLVELESYHLELGERTLRRVVSTCAEAELGRDQISRLLETPDGLVIEGAGRSVGIPSSLTAFDEVRQRLIGWRPVDQARPAGARAIGLSLALVGGTTGAWYAAMNLEASAGRIAAAAVLYGTLFALHWKVGRHPDVPRRMKTAIVLMSIYLGIGPPMRLFQELIMPSLAQAASRTDSASGDGPRD
jgi:hypothetical protein